ncbi:uncharacterized protein LOC123198932 [Mangifera indica]|uniref:uncharacterized protein LOC123198932 n=1 Tax=Mangifera indica TaxID=29780 RepID=UPI001CFBC41E|nr:uncharacterized protein LOC123198932 [Mangifera indica]
MDEFGFQEKIFGQLREKGREINEDPFNNQKLKEYLGGRGLGLSDQYKLQQQLQEVANSVAKISSSKRHANASSTSSCQYHPRDPIYLQQQPKFLRLGFHSFHTHKEFYKLKIFTHDTSIAKIFKDSLRSPSYEKHETEESEKKPTAEIKNYLIEAVSLFQKFRCLYADLILDHNERKESYSLISSKQSAEEAFKLVAVELGFMYDLLYTKTTTIYSMSGMFLRCICLFSHISVCVVFFINIDKSSYSQTDISITYLLLLGAVFLEFYAFIVLLLSDWTKLWLTKRKSTSIDRCSTGLLSNDNRRWSRSMGQYNLISFSLSESRKSKKSFNLRVQKTLGIKELIDKYKYLSWKELDNDLLEMIFKQLQRKSKEIKDDHFDMKRCKELLSQRGEYVSSERVYVNDLIRSSTIDVEFDYSLLLWHVTTDLCYYDDFRNLREGQKLPPECKISKWLSDYMLYLLVVCPTMMPKGIGELRYIDTCVETTRFLRKNKGSYIKTDRAAYLLLQFYKTWDQYNKDKNYLSVLGHGCELAQQLQRLNMVGDENERNVKWELISEVWMEMLEYAASHCGWKEHGQGLANGGELLTHVCLLMAHLGLSEQYQIQQQPIHQRWTTQLFVTAVVDWILYICGYFLDTILYIWNQFLKLINSCFWNACTCFLCFYVTCCSDRH